MVFTSIKHPLYFKYVLNASQLFDVNVFEFQRSRLFRFGLKFPIIELIASLL